MGMEIAFFLLATWAFALWGAALVDWYAIGLGGESVGSDGVRYRRCLADLEVARQQLAFEQKRVDRMTRSLAKITPAVEPTENGLAWECCGGPIGTNYDGGGSMLQFHADDCGWIEARRWVEENPE